MEPNCDQKTLESKASKNPPGLVAMGASSVRTENSVKSRILERVKAQMAQDSLEFGHDRPPIYLKAPDWPVDD